MTQGVLTALLTTSLLTLSPTPPAISPTNLTLESPLKMEAVHVVAKDESLMVIAQEEYGNTIYWTNLWNDNSWIEDSRVIEVGWKLKIRKNKAFLVEPLLPTLARKQSEVVAQIPSPEASPSATPAAQYQQSNFDDVYKQAGAKYGVSWQILYGIHLTETGLRNGDISNHAGSGAQGPMQFMPGTWRAYGVDGDNDGVPDINNAIDAIYGAANYLQKHGSLMNGLHAYGGNVSGVLAAAKARGFTE